jgi:hypothetical protein
VNAPRWWEDAAAAEARTHACDPPDGRPDAADLARDGEEARARRRRPLPDIPAFADPWPGDAARAPCACGGVCPVCQWVGGAA